VHLFGEFDDLNSIHYKTDRHIFYWKVKKNTKKKIEKKKKNIARIVLDSEIRSESE
jgi:hypothetical protein